MLLLNTTRNPKYNTRINPNYNTQINPKYNTRINPKYNTLINPKYNTIINPKYNTLINPKYNTKVNPKYNTLINPKYNTKVNPKYNRNINPNYHTGFEGYFIFSLNGEIIGYIVKVENIILLFNERDEQVKFGILHSQKGYVIYDLQLNLISHLESNGENGYNEFDFDNVWQNYIS